MVHCRRYRNIIFVSEIEMQCVRQREMGIKKISNGIAKVMVGIIYTVRLYGREILRLFVSKLMRVFFLYLGIRVGERLNYRVLYVCLPMIEVLLLIVSMLLNTVLVVLVLRNN